MDNKFIDRIDELDWKVLQELSKDKKTVFEFGTFIGGSAMAMLPQIKEAGGICGIDHFRDNISQPPELHIHPLRSSCSDFSACGTIPRYNYSDCWGCNRGFKFS